MATKSYNAGVFCLEADSPHWRVWAHYMGIALRNSPSTISDQTVLNYAIFKEHLRVYPLSALCNWCCHLALPRVVDGRLCEPFIPHAPIGIVHLSGLSEKDHAIQYNAGGKRATRSLRYSGARRDEGSR
jgi:hypothetical protein